MGLLYTFTIIQWWPKLLEYLEDRFPIVSVEMAFEILKQIYKVITVPSNPLNRTAVKRSFQYKNQARSISH